ncbi:MAG: response regulator transcription factor [Lachnospiraceae bacterium]|nr:response regulator transcription factor [Lachnospiraceae bacterium]
MAKILVVEDNHDYQELLQNFLESAKHEITPAGDDVSALALLSRHSFDLILLDIMLPGNDGFDICEKIRAQGNTTPVVMLTALDNESYQMRGYKLRIDDYITKPVSMPLLLHKVEAILRRTIPAVSRDAHDALHFEDITLDLRTHTVHICDTDVAFTLREFEILQELMQEPGSVVTRKSLIEKLWGYDFYGDTRIVDTHMKNIRKKLGVSDYIETIRGVGYKLRKDNSQFKNKPEGGSLL